MEESLKGETERLTRSWMQHEADWLRHYLVQGVEDPRINLQSIFSRHFLVRAQFREQFLWLMEQECRFAAVMNWLMALSASLGETEELASVHHALKRGLDNAEGISIPRFVVHTFASLPAAQGQCIVPNYIASFLAGTQFTHGKPVFHVPAFDTFAELWNKALADALPEFSSRLAPQASLRASVIEPACGSANDYRFLDSYGLARWLDYTGLELCSKNVENARQLFPGARFQLGNVFEIAAGDRAFDLCYVHDLFEHLSPAGLVVAVREVCRVTLRGICIGFFNLDEIPEHLIRPFEEYHWNTLSLCRLKELFASHGFTGHIIHVGTFLRQHFGAETHNPNAYTFLLWRTG